MVMNCSWVDARSMGWLVSLAAWYSGLVVIVKLGVQCLKNPTRPQNERI